MSQSPAIISAVLFMAHPLSFACRVLCNCILLPPVRSFCAYCARVAVVIVSFLFSFVTGFHTQSRPQFGAIARFVTRTPNAVQRTQHNLIRPQTRTLSSNPPSLSFRLSWHLIGPTSSPPCLKNLLLARPHKRNASCSRHCC